MHRQIQGLFDLFSRHTDLGVHLYAAQLLRKIVLESYLLTVLLYQVHFSLDEDFWHQFRKLLKVFSDVVQVVSIILVEKGNSIALAHQLLVIEHVMELVLFYFSEYYEFKLAVVDVSGRARATALSVGIDY